MDRAIERYWRRFHTKVRKATKKLGGDGSRRPRTLVRRSEVAAYSGAVLDRMGRQGVYMSVEYMGARRSRVGVARRLVIYVTRDGAVERDSSGEPIILSNVGADPDEQAMAFDLVEMLNRAAQSDAKVVFSMIVNLPHDISPEARREILDRFCHDAFELHDLPFVAAIHEPSAEGDQRNKHAHIVFSLRPMQHVGDHEWEVGRELLAEFDCPERFAYLRKHFAEVMTAVVIKEGKTRTYTHLSNAERGLKNKPLRHLGPAKTASLRRGEVVADNEYNRAEIALNEVLSAEDTAAGVLEHEEGEIAELRRLHAALLPVPTMLEVIPVNVVVGDPGMPVWQPANYVRDLSIDLRTDHLLDQQVTVGRAAYRIAEADLWPIVGTPSAAIGAEPSSGRDPAVSTALPYLLPGNWQPPVFHSPMAQATPTPMCQIKSQSVASVVEPGRRLPVPSVPDVQPIEKPAYASLLTETSPGRQIDVQIPLRISTTTVSGAFGLKEWRVSKPAFAVVNGEAAPSTPLRSKVFCSPFSISPIRNRVTATRARLVVADQNVDERLVPLLILSPKHVKANTLPVVISSSAMTVTSSEVADSELQKPTSNVTFCKKLKSPEPRKTVAFENFVAIHRQLRERVEQRRKAREKARLMRRRFTGLGDPGIGR